MKARLELEKMVHGGAVLGRLAGGRVALVYGGIAGEIVELNLSEISGVLQGKVGRVITASPYRIEKSEHPGLDYSFISYEGQLELKRQVVEDALSRSLRRKVAVPPLIAAPKQWYYRHAVQPAVSKAGLGYRLPGSHELIALPFDPVAHEAINRAWSIWLKHAPVKGVRELAFRCNDDGEVLLCLIATASARNFVSLAHDLVRAGISGVSYAAYDARGRFRGGFERLAGKRFIKQNYGDFDISVTATSFAQPNPAAATLLYEELASWTNGGAVAVDLYAGSGIIGFYLAKKYARVLALDLDKSSVVRGQHDAERLAVDNLEFLRIDARKLAALPKAELVCVDPPRAGLSKNTRQLISDSSASWLCYVSCNVATLARDLAQFEAAGFKLESLQAYDFYPQTHHIEMLSLLTR